MQYVAESSGLDSRMALISDDDGSNDRGNRGPGLGPNPKGFLYLAAMVWEWRHFCSA